MSFNNYNLKPETLKFIELNGFKKPTPIQEKVIPVALKGRNVIAISKTGSGKSHAFLIPIMNLIDCDSKNLQVIITAPTRELASQLYWITKIMSKANPKLKIVKTIGGEQRSKVVEQLKGGAHLLIGTPGRILDMVIKEQAIRVDKVQLLVVDEADMTFEYGFLNDVDIVASKMPKDLRMMVFGATIPKQIQPFLKKYLKNPLIFDLVKKAPVKTIEYVLVACKHRSYNQTLLDILPGINPFVCLIFANTRQEVHECATFLASYDYEVLELHGGLEARKRQQALKQLNSKKFTYIVASDLAARGLDIPEISHVISLGFPKEIDFFIHRSGRTGRMEQEGICITLFQESDEPVIKQLVKRGIPFKYRRYKAGKWIELKPRIKRTGMSDLDKEVAKITSRKKTVVKPGYKKKRQEEIEKLKRKKKRELVQNSINEQKKENYKTKQRQKRMQEK